MSLEKGKPLTGKEHLRNLFLVMGGAVCVAIFIVYILVTRFGPTGEYRLDHVLLNPETLTNLSYVERGAGAKEGKRMVLHDIQFFHPDPETRFWKKVSVPIGNYGEFYRTIEGLRSISPVDEGVQRLFLEPGMLSLSIVVKPEGAGELMGQVRTFQEVQFASEGSYFRVEVHVDDPGSVNWAYFRKEGVLGSANVILGGGMR